VSPRPPVPYADDRQHQPVGRLAVVPADAVAERKGIVSVLSGNERSGAWAMPRKLRVVAVCGGTKLDLRQAQIGAGVSEVEVFVIAGNVTIVVPPELRVEHDVDTLAGGVEYRAMASPEAAGAVLRVHGSVIAGAVEIEVREPGDERRYRPGLPPFDRGSGGGRGRLGAGG